MLEGFHSELGPGTAPFDEILEVYVQLKKLLYMLEAPNAPIQIADAIKVEIPESPYDIHKGTPFENKRTELRPTIFPHYTPREQVHYSIIKRIKLHKRIAVYRDINNRYPRSRYKDEYPLTASLDLFVNTYIPKYGKADQLSIE